MLSPPSLFCLERSRSFEDLKTVLKGGPDCTLDSFCSMVAEAAEKFGVEHFGIGSAGCGLRCVHRGSPEYL